MEKISGIVRGSSRISATDLKQAAPVRPGAPSYGRPVGESTGNAAQVRTSTASRAVALHKDLNEAKRAVTQERAIAKIANEFFMNRMEEPQVEAPSTEELVISEQQMEAPEPPREYTPRGSYVDVRA